MQYTNVLKRSTLPATIAFVVSCVSPGEFEESERPSVRGGHRFHMCVTLGVPRLVLLVAHGLLARTCRFSEIAQNCFPFRFIGLRFFHWKCAFKIYCSHKHKINCQCPVLTIEITICRECKVTFGRPRIQFWI